MIDKNEFSMTHDQYRKILDDEIKELGAIIDMKVKLVLRSKQIDGATIDRIKSIKKNCIKLHSLNRLRVKQDFNVGKDAVYISDEIERMVQRNIEGKSDGRGMF